MEENSDLKCSQQLTVDMHLMCGIGAPEILPVSKDYISPAGMIMAAQLCIGQLQMDLIKQRQPC